MKTDKSNCHEFLEGRLLQREPFEAVFDKQTTAESVWPAATPQDWTVTSERINSELRQHQEQVPDWSLAGEMGWLYAHADGMISEFKVQIPQPCLSVDDLSQRAQGRFRSGRNGFGLRNEIVIAREHLAFSPKHEVEATLLHELLHSWQQIHGKPGRRNCHNREFRAKAESLGLSVDAKGITQILSAGPSQFHEFLAKIGVPLPSAPEPRRVARPSKPSKLKLYECPCGVKVRIGRSRINARCLDCDGVFQLKDSAPTETVQTIKEASPAASGSPNLEAAPTSEQHAASHLTTWEH